MRISISVLFCASVVSLTNAKADSLDVILAPIQGTSACWERSYTADHLSNHPRQKVTNVRFDLGYREWEDDQAGQGEYTFSIAIETRERRGTEGGLCHSDDKGNTVCAVDCDGGAIELRRRSPEEGSLYLELLFGGLRLEDCGSDEAFWLSAEPDDRVFLVHPVACQE